MDTLASRTSASWGESVVIKASQDLAVTISPSIFEVVPHILILHLHGDKPLSLLPGPWHMLVLLPEMYTALVPGNFQTSVRLISGAPTLMVLRTVGILFSMCVHTHPCLSNSLVPVLFVCMPGAFPPGIYLMQGLLFTWISSSVIGRCILKPINAGGICYITPKRPYFPHEWIGPEI